jgi:hypothetical protein
MRAHRIAIILITAALAVTLVASSVSAKPIQPAPASDTTAPVSSAFTYQGRLDDAAGPLSGAYDLRFTLHEVAAGGSTLATVTRDDVTVDDGLFTVSLDFGAAAFTGTARWLEVSVRPGSSTGGYTVLTPRQAVTAVPYALHALSIPSHQHVGETWTGNGTGTGLTLTGLAIGLFSGGSEVGVLGTGTVGVQGSSGFPTGKGVLGSASADSGETYGVYGQSQSTSGTGVYGQATKTTGVTNGVVGYSQSTAGTGMFGWAGASSGSTIGVHGRSDSGEGEGLYGFAAATTGSTTGVKGVATSGQGTGVYGEGGRYGVQAKGATGVEGTSESSSGKGVYGIASAPSGTTSGVYGESVSGTGRGVFGISWATSGHSTGVYGESKSVSGRGVVGDATATSGTTYGVVGYSASDDGFAGYFRNTAGGVGLYAMTNEGDGNIFEAWSGFTEQEFRVERDGDVRADGAYGSGGSAVTVLMPVVGTAEPGDVLALRTDWQLERADGNTLTTVVGVYADQPGVILGAGADGAWPAGHVPVAVSGVVWVKVAPPGAYPMIAPGTPLVSSDYASGGYATATLDLPTGAVIGKALDSHAGPLDGLVRMLVMLR